MVSKAVPSVQNAKQGKKPELPEKWAWVETSVWTDRMLAALENGVKGGKWFSLIDKISSVRTLTAAWEQVAANRGSAGVDRISIDRFREHSSRYLEELSSALREGTYRPHAVKRVYIPKGGGKMRPLGIPTVKDRIVQTALKMALEPIFENEFHSNSFGFRPGRGCKDALREVDHKLQAGHTYVVDADLSSYFDTIPHEALLRRVKGKVSDGRVLDLIQAFLDQDIMEDMKSWTPMSGTPQGAVISPLLSNLYLHELDVLINGAGYTMVRYADDFVILCQNEFEAEGALSLVQKWVAQNGLSLHPEKTQVGDASKPGEGFAFLGYRFEAGKRYVRKKSMASLRERIRKKTKRSCGQSLDEIISRLNPMLKGWFEYFKHANKHTFPLIDGFVRRRLRSILRRQLKRSRGTGRNHLDHKRWPNAFFAGHGLFTMKEARAKVSQSR